jgi:hypothetical protein
MTLAEIQQATGVPADHIIKELGLPAGVEKDERLGRLRSTYGFAVNDVRHIVQGYQQSEAQPPLQ